MVKPLQLWLDLFVLRLHRIAYLGFGLAEHVSVSEVGLYQVGKECIYGDAWEQYFNLG